MSNENAFISQLILRLPLMTSKTRAYWMQNKRKLAYVLKNALMSETASPEPSTRWTIKILSSLAFNVRITRGNYDSVDKKITKRYFSHDSTSVGIWECKLFDFVYDVSSIEVATVMQNDGWIVAKLDHLLAFGENCSDEDCKGPILALGEPCLINNYHEIPVIECDDMERKLELVSSCPKWSTICSFLGVRRMDNI